MADKIVKFVEEECLDKPEDVAQFRRYFGGNPEKKLVSTYRVQGRAYVRNVLLKKCVVAECDVDAILDMLRKLRKGEEEKKPSSKEDEPPRPADLGISRSIRAVMKKKTLLPEYLDGANSSETYHSKSAHTADVTADLLYAINKGLSERGTYTVSKDFVDLLSTSFGDERRALLVNVIQKMFTYADKYSSMRQLSPRMFCDMLLHCVPDTMKDDRCLNYFWTWIARREKTNYTRMNEAGFWVKLAMQYVAFCCHSGAFYSEKVLPIRRSIGRKDLQMEALISWNAIRKEFPRGQKPFDGQTMDMDEVAVSVSELKRVACHFILDLNAGELDRVLDKAKDRALRVSFGLRKSSSSPGSELYRKAMGDESTPRTKAPGSPTEGKERGGVSGADDPDL